ncbi:MAG: hypothetical protein J0I06_15775 [Planctomycetes bacterium]|nr:hypothetical protein [Planctomycetota bacterium]
MARWVYLLTAFTVLAAWAGAQNPAPPLSAEDKLRLLRANGTLLDNLVRDGVALSAADTPDRRAEECRRSALNLANAIGAAAAAEDAERVAELTGLFRDIVRDGLVPTINDGLATVPPQSPAARKLREVQGHAADDVTKVKAATGKWAENPRIKDALKQLDQVAEGLK